MAYNLQSLLYSINQILNPVPKRFYVHELEKEKLETLLQKVNTLQQILEKLPLPTYNRLKEFEIQVIDLSHRAEDLVDSAFVNQVSIQRIGTFLQDLQNVIKEFDSFTKIVSTMVDSSQRQNIVEDFDDLTFVDPIPESSSGAAEGCARMSSSGSSLKRRFTSEDVADLPARKGVAGNQTCSGLDEHTDKLVWWLTGEDKQPRVVISIAGMGGIGKTTLAQKLYDHPSIVEHYDFRAWVTISQESEVEPIISTLLSRLPKIQSDNDDLSLRLYQTLFNRRYLIVLDDIWSTDTLDKLLSTSFPDNGNSSTIILTTRDQEVAARATQSRLHKMNLLGSDDSWKLFSANVGARKCLDHRFKMLGTNIVQNCQGLPLAISVISGLLSKSDNIDLWEHVADNISSTVALDQRCLEILSLSYDHLPHHLRPCLLYLGAFPKGIEIPVSKLKRLWAADGFLKPIDGKTTLEEVATKYLEDLANRNLLVVGEMKSCGKKVKSYGMHDLLKDLCVTRAAQEHFVVCSEYGHVKKALDTTIKAQYFRRALFNKKHSKLILDDVSELLRASNLLRVLDLPEEFLRDQFPGEILQLINIRYLSLSCKLLPVSLSRLWNLETFIIFCNHPSEDIDIPDEMWQLQKLKHFELIGEVIGIVELQFSLGILQTLSIVRGKTFVSNLIEKIPNIKELGMELCDHDNSQDIDLSRLYNLEKLKMRTVSQFLIGFPSSISKMTLLWCYMDENSMKIIGELPCLKVLKLQDCGWMHLADEKDWRTYEDGFPSLVFLQLGIINLTEWNTEDEAHFPVLRHLLIRGCKFLKKIPSCIGDVETLEIIEIERSRKSVVKSAKRIRKKQRELCNDDFQLRIGDYGEKEDEDEDEDEEDEDEEEEEE